MSAQAALLRTDRKAIETLQEAYGPGYKVVGVRSREVLLNAGKHPLHHSAVGQGRLKPQGRICQDRCWLQRLRRGE